MSGNKMRTALRADSMTGLTCLLMGCASLVACAPSVSQQTDTQPLEPRKITKLADVDAPQSVVWDTWTTSDGIQTFLVPQANVSLDIGSPYELTLAADGAEGRQGTQGCTVVDSVPVRKLSFEVTSPPSLGLGATRTSVTVRLIPLNDDMTRVQLVHEGFLHTPEWNDAHFYFDELWTDTMKRLRTRFQEGPIDWSGSPVDFEWR